MNESFDALEAELAALKPREPSPQLRQRIADHLATDAPAPARSRSSQAWWSGALTGGVVAACLAAGLLLLRPARERRPDTESPLAPLQLSAADAFDDALPTVWTYQRALARSSRDFETLLDKHAAASPSMGGTAQRHLLIQSDTRFLLQGEL